MSSVAFSRVAILGPGVLGGSLALALQARSPDTQVVVWGRRAEAIAEVLALGICSEATTDLSGALQGADLVILCTPIGVMGKLAEFIASAELAPDAIVTDVGSVKHSVLQSVTPALTGSGFHFVGSHPMAGSEQVGISAARKDLFDDARCIVVEEPGKTVEEAKEKIVAFWRAIGSNVSVMGAKEHDAAVAKISHLPHAVSALIAIAALRETPEIAALAGNGFKDTTRIAAGSPEMWTEILLENKEAVEAALRSTADLTQDLLASLEAMDEERLRQLLAEAKELRDAAVPNLTHD